MSILVVARKEFADAVRSRMLWGIVALVAVATSLGFGVSLFVPGGASVYTAIGGATQLAGILVPILALVAAYLAIAGERESGSIKVLLGLPPSRGEVLLGKFLGRSAVVVAGILVGFAVASVVATLVYGAVPVVAFFETTLLSAALGVVFVGIAIGISASTRSRARAMAASVGVYLLLTLFWDLVPEIAMILVRGATGPGASIPPWYLLLKSLSPTGAYNALVGAILSGSTGTPGLAAALGGAVPFYLQPWAMVLVLVGWAGIPLLVGYRAFRRADIS